MRGGLYAFDCVLYVFFMLQKYIYTQTGIHKPYYEYATSAGLSTKNKSKYHPGLRISRMVYVSMFVYIDWKYTPRCVPIEMKSQLLVITL